LKIKQRSVPTSGIWGKVSPRFYRGRCQSLGEVIFIDFL
jgi:hypothetical protein